MIVKYFFSYRSKDFRQSFGRLAKIHSFVPPYTHLIACTATASRSLKKEVIDSLKMSDYVEVTASPVASTSTMRSSVAKRVKAVDVPRLLVYCQSLNMCADLHAHLYYELGETSYYPPGSPHVMILAIWDATQYNKDVILKHPQASCGSANDSQVTCKSFASNLLVSHS